MATSIAILVSPFAVVAIELRPLSRKSPFSREKIARPCVDDEDNDEYDDDDDDDDEDDDEDDDNSNNNTTTTITRRTRDEDERRVRRRHSELSRSGAPLFIPHVMLCGRYVMLVLLLVNLISLSLFISLARSFPLSSFLFRLFFFRRFPLTTIFLQLSHTFYLFLHLCNN